MLRSALVAGIVLTASAAFAQLATRAPEARTSEPNTSEPKTPPVAGGSKSMGDLLSEGFEIKSSAPSGTKFIVFMQKDKTAYACEFVSLTKSRCGAIN